MRRITAQLTIEPPAGSGSGPKEVDLNFDLTLSDVNQPQTIEAPSEAKPLNDLFRQLGINPLSLLGNNGGLNLNGLEAPAAPVERAASAASCRGSAARPAARAAAPPPAACPRPT